MLQGRLRTGAHTYEQAMQVTPGRERLQTLVNSADYYFGMGDLLREWNKLDEAEQHLTQGMDLARGTLTVYAEIVTLGYTALARLQQARGNFQGALATLSAFAELADQRHFVPRLLAWAAAVQAELELAHGNLEAAERWVEESGLSASDEEKSYPREREYLSLARCALPRGTAVLVRLLHDAERNARGGSVIEILILQALALQAQGWQKQALAVLQRVLAWLNRRATRASSSMRIQRAGATISSVVSIHVPMVSHPDVIATLIARAAAQEKRFLYLPRLQLAQLHIDRQLLAAAVDVYRDGIAGIFSQQRIGQRRKIVHGFVINLHDYVTDLQARGCRRTTRDKASNQCPMIDGEVVLRGERGINAGGAYSKHGPPRMGDYAILDDLRHDEGDAVGGDGKADTIGGCIKFRVDGSQGGNTDQVPLQVYQRAAAIAGIDGRVGLNSIGYCRAALPLGDAAPQGADDAVCDSLRDAQWVANRQHVLTYLQFG